MSARSRKPEPPMRDVRQYWVERGYRPEVAASPISANEDPKGEQAYQRAFAEAAMADPPRLPNPQWYPNSTSAQEWVRKRNSDMMAPRAPRRPENDSDGHFNSRGSRDPDRSPLLSSVKPEKDTSSIPDFVPKQQASTSLSLPRMSSNPPSSQQPLGTPTTSSQQFFQAPRLTVLEPYCGPSGPGNKLR